MFGWGWFRGAVRVGWSRSGKGGAPKPSAGSRLGLPELRGFRRKRVLVVSELPAPQSLPAEHVPAFPFFSAFAGLCAFDGSGEPSRR